MRLRHSAVGALGAAALLGAVLVPLSSASASSGVTLAGHGFGHGRGLGQYGAYGYAVDRGWPATRILDHFYGGTSSGTAPNTLMSVRLTALDGVEPLTVTSGDAFVVGGIAVTAGLATRITRSPQGLWQLATAPGGCSSAAFGGQVSLPSDPLVAPTTDPGDDVRRMLTVCSTGRAYRGSLRAVFADGARRLVNVLPVESYLRGVVPREVPATWGADGGGRGLQALIAQSVAARSYALSENRTSYAKTCDTTACQVYGGAGLNSSRIEHALTDQAIAATSGLVRRSMSGAVARTEFSASTGGWTAGGAFPAVVDEGDTRSPYHDWSVFLTSTSIGAAYPDIGDFNGLEVLQRNGLGAEGGRVLSLRVWGSRGSVQVSGDAFRSALGLRSNWFTPAAPTQLLWYLRDGASAGESQHTFSYGGPLDRPVTCDWNADGKDGVGVYSSGWWYLRNSPTGGSPEVAVSYGTSSYTAVCGDWDGNGTDTMGVYDGSTFYLRNTNTPGPPDIAVAYGWPAARPVVGDWDGNGTDTIGVYHDGWWYLRNSNTAGPPDVSSRFGIQAYQPVPGDWDGDGQDTYGVYDRGTFHLRNALAAGSPDASISYGIVGDTGVRGNYDGTAGDGIGVSRQQ